MRIFIPYTQLRPETLISVKGLPFTLVQMSEELFGYYQYFISRWEEGETFINLEHDILPTKKILQELWNCPKPWCGIGYGGEDSTAYLGCVKFSKEFIKANPDLWKDPIHWGECDIHIVASTKIPYHAHSGEVKHLHGLPIDEEFLRDENFYPIH